MPPSPDSVELGVTNTPTSPTGSSPRSSSVEGVITATGTFDDDHMSSTTRSSAATSLSDSHHETLPADEGEDDDASTEQQGFLHRRGGLISVRHDGGGGYSVVSGTTDTWGGGGGGDDTYSVDDEDRMCPRYMIWTMICVLVVALLAVLLPGIRSKSNELEVLRKPARIPVEYKCPLRGEGGLLDETATGGGDLISSSTPTTGKDEFGDDTAVYDVSDTNDYQQVVQAITNNMTEFLDTFRNSNFDSWGRSYKDVKEGMRHFKTTHYPEYVQDGSTIYESACGIGLNLYMTLELLQEATGIENIFVYGNDVLPVSTNKANAILDKVAPAHGKRGVICAGESSDLSFVPANSFDLVYTGYLSPVLDPLHLAGGNTNENYGRYSELCDAANDDWKGQTLNSIAQKRQDDWYGKWVAQMARIAKPGVPISVEQISQRYCDAKFDWGGVNKEFWHISASNNTYGWNVNPESIIVEDDTIFRDRYHVFMIKNGKREAR